MSPEDDTCDVVDMSQYDTCGFCPDYALKRHKYETMANAGCLEARLDWARYIGRVDEFGGCNPLNGNFTAVVLPLCRPERLSLVAYVLEYAFLHDKIVEVAASSYPQSEEDDFSLGDEEIKQKDVKSGRKQIQAKIMLQLSSTDAATAKRVMDVWKTMLSTTLRDKSNDFGSLDEYLDFRIVDTGAPFVAAVMLFGMGMVLTDDEHENLASVVRPCFASLALANDYFSFDKEWDEAQEPGAPNLVNAVWLYMQWQGVDIASAKRLVREAANHYERQFLSFCDNFRRKHAPLSERVDRYLRGLSYQICGNVIWSLNCPRYHPEYRYDPNAGIEDTLTREIRGLHAFDDLTLTRAFDNDLHQSDTSIASASSVDSASNSRSRSPSISSQTSFNSVDLSKSPETADGEKLGQDHLEAPFYYTSSLPSKGVRDTLVDALGLWSGLSEEDASKVKEVVHWLHTASLMLDDIEDRSELRRGSLAAHTVFGVPQTINSATFAILEAVNKAKESGLPNAVDITLEQLRILHVGQSYDLYWTRHATCPSEEEYLEMVSKKTGGLFQLLWRLINKGANDSVKNGVNDLVHLIGLYFQIRDDYQNLRSDEYTAQKGFCEDLDEGKFSFPLIHALNIEPPNPQLKELLQWRQEHGRLSTPAKRHILQLLNESGSMEYTQKILLRLKEQVFEALSSVESVTGQKNWVLRLCLEKLRI